MKYFIVLVLMVAMISVMLTAPVRQLAETYDHSQLEKLWSDFKTKFNKQYKDLAPVYLIIIIISVIDSISLKLTIY